MVSGVALLALVMSLEPDVGFTAPPLARLLFWTLQIAVGLLVLQSVLYLLTRRFGASRIPSWALVLLSAVLGAAALAPLYWLIGEGLMQHGFGYPARPDEDGDDPIGHPLVAEYFEIVGPVTTAWALICLPRLHWLVPPLLLGKALSAPTGIAQGDTGRDPAPTPARADPLVCDALPLTPSAQPPRPMWCERLPTELGTEVIAVASELQYLRVWTPRGCALILGALADVESEGAAQGLRVHRSWWVACEHVVSVRRTASGAVCLMSDGLQVPVSRRRRAEVLARFGDGVRYRVADASEAVAHPDLH